MNHLPLSRLLVLLSTALLGSAHVSAAGLGNAAGTVVMGERLQLEIPLIEPGSSSIDCYRLQANPHGSDPDYFPRRTEIAIKPGADGKPARLVIAGPLINQPVVEFQVAITCDAYVARNYVLFSAPGRELNYAPAVPPVALPVAATPAVPRTGASGQKDRLGPSLEQMAGSRYPGEVKKRAEFKRRMREANGLLQNYSDRAPIPLDTALIIPEDVEPEFAPPPKPERTATKKKVKQGKHPAAKSKKKAAPAKSVKAAKATEPPALPSPQPVTPPVVAAAGDRLTISSGSGETPGSNPVAGGGTGNNVLAEKAATSFAAQDEMTVRLAQSEATLQELKDVILRMESRMANLEQERQRLQEENRQKSEWPLLQIALSILGGGLIGALVMLKLQRKSSSNPF